MIITNKFTMDLQRSGIPHVIDVVQGDKNSREVEISLYSGGAPWNVPDGAIGIVRFRKPDGTGGAYDTMPDDRTRAVEISKNILTVRLAPQVLTVAGEVNAQVEMVLGDISLATFSFIVDVAEDPSIGTLESEDYINISNFVSAEVNRAIEEGGLSAVEGRLDAIEKDIADLKDEFKGGVTSVNGQTGDVTIEIPEMEAITVDSAFSGTSENPLQNKVITQTMQAFTDMIADEILPGLLPRVSVDDNGKIPRVVNGAWAAVTINSAEGASF